MSPRHALASIVVLAVASLYASGPAVAAPVGDCQPGGDWPAASPDMAADVVARVNAHRAGRGLAPLTVSPTLTAAAEWKARHMARYGYMAHDDPAPPVQRSPFERMQACGYPEQALAGENVAAGYDSPASVMEGWLGSSGHRANIERAEFRAIGVGVARAAGGSLYWTQDFGSVADAAAPPPAAPAPTPPVSQPPRSPSPVPRPTVGEPFSPGARLRVLGCRQARRSRHAVLCRLALSWGPAVVHARLRQRGTRVASGTARAASAGRVRLRLRGRPAVRPGRAVLRLRAGDVRMRRAVRVRG